jgi:hypothetical protein
MSAQFHEHLQHDDAAPRASDRSFGVVFTVVFAIVGLLPLLDGHAVRWWALGIAAAFAALAFIRPALLAPLNRVWMAFGKLLHKFVSPLILGLLFLIAVVPTSLWLRLRGADPLRLKPDPSAPSYWLPRDPPGPARASFKNQF